MTDNENYSVKELDPAFHIKNFVLYYKEYLDLPLIRTNENKFNEILQKVRNEVSKVGNVDKNLLFISEEDISDYVFFSAFLMLPKLMTHRRMNYMNVIDVWNGNTRYSNERLDDDEMFLSEQDIREDVLSVSIDKDMRTDPLMGKVLDTIVVTRASKLNKRLDGNLITWLFYKGTESNMINDKVLHSTYELFNSNRSKYKIIKLPSIIGTSFKSGVVSATEDKSLGDMY